MIRRFSETEQEEFISQLMMWCRDGEITCRVFPRDFYSSDIKVRHLVEGYEDIVILVDKVNAIDCYLSIFSYPQIRERLYDVIYLDIDEPENYVKIKERINTFPYTSFFTGRSYHIYLKFGEMKFKDYRKTVREFCRRYKLLELIDKRTLGDVRREARLPMTWNSKTNKRARFLEYHEGDVEKLRSILQEIDDRHTEIINGIEEHRRFILDKNNKFDDFPPCIQACIDEIVATGELSHDKRLHLASFLIWIWDYEDVEALFSLCNDYKPYYTRQQLDFILEREYYPYSCKNAKMLGICPITIFCPYAPSLHLVLKKEEEGNDKSSRKK
ncbi:archaeal/eukaryotic-type DNA primase large subunit [uncultured archaeal virus]|jgi:hypothetical protein|uniref:Archaeal/eukaryotic-type DNA primase large subunit n=1 Tax=uncultured archaeal virus TaxID=1960247 RepID=A0A1S5Y2Y2_9VIRU|nr:archaeal/eukaryotic-type DNA primase large subunit [uncultured archaeal virus]